MNEWHLSRAEIEAYAAQRAGEVASWSAEEHLIACASCRGWLSSVVRAGPVGVALAAARERAQVALDEVSPVRMESRGGVLGPALGRAVGLTRAPWLWVTLLASASCLAVAGLLLVAGGAALASYRGVVLALAPLAPIAGAAASALRRADPCAEVVASTPDFGLGLILRRCLHVLLAALPLTALAAMWAGGRSALGVQVVSIALVSATLVLGSRLGVERAGMLVALLWTVVAAAPAMALRPTVAFADPRTAVVAAVVGAVAGVGVLVRRDDFALLSAATGSRQGDLA